LNKKAAICVKPPPAKVKVRLSRALMMSHDQEPCSHHNPLYHHAEPKPPVFTIEERLYVPDELIIELGQDANKHLPVQTNRFSELIKPMWKPKDALRMQSLERIPQENRTIMYFYPWLVLLIMLMIRITNQ
jgi:hypothetical protein